MNTNCKKLDQVQYRAMRYYCGLPRSTSICGMEGDFGWLPGIIKRDVLVIKFYNHVIHKVSSNVTRQVFELDRTMNSC